jgi:hypothetical protein
MTPHEHDILHATTHAPVAPRTVKYLGYGGLIPFVMLALAGAVDPYHGSRWQFALLAYGGVILSFVGALHWGFAMSCKGLSELQRASAFVWSIVPALVAWLALLLSPPITCALLIAGFWVHFWQDTRLAAPAGLPQWYLPLRLQLTVLASLSLLSIYV